jgi:hypothetical protein
MKFCQIRAIDPYALRSAKLTRYVQVYDSWGGEGLQQYEDERLDAFEAALGLTSPLYAASWSRQFPHSVPQL